MIIRHNNQRLDRRRLLFTSRLIVTVIGFVVRPADAAWLVRLSPIASAPLTSAVIVISPCLTDCQFVERKDFVTDRCCYGSLPAVLSTVLHRHCAGQRIGDVTLLAASCLRWQTPACR